MSASESFDFDRLQQRWQAQDERLDQVLTLNRRLLRTLEEGRARTALQGVARMLWTQVAIDALAVFGLGMFIGHRAEHAAAELRYLVPASLLLVAAVAVLATAIHQLVLLSRIDPAGPVTEMQRRLERLRAFRIRVTKVVVLSALVLWVPLAVVGLRALFGFDWYAWFPNWYLGLNVAIGLAFIPLALWISRRFGERLGRNPAVRRWVDDLAGRSLNEASAKLEALAAFAREDRS